MENKYLLTQLTFSHKVYGEIKFNIPNKGNVVNWKAKSFVDQRGELKFLVTNSHGHTKEFYIKSDGTVVTRDSKVPAYVSEFLNFKMNMYKQFFNSIKAPNLNY